MPQEVKERLQLPYWKIAQSRQEGVQQINNWTNKGMKVALKFGAFDIPHYRHAEDLAAIRELTGTDKVAVGLDTDEFLMNVPTRKDLRGPIIPWELRAKHLAHYPYVDLIFPKDNVEPEWIRGIKPTFVVFSTTSFPGMRGRIEQLLPYLNEIGAKVILIDDHSNLVPNLDEFERLSIEFANVNHFGGTSIRREFNRRAIEDLKGE